MLDRGWPHSGRSICFESRQLFFQRIQPLIDHWQAILIKPFLLPLKMFDLFFQRMNSELFQIGDSLMGILFCRRIRKHKKRQQAKQKGKLRFHRNESAISS